MSGRVWQQVPAGMGLLVAALALMPSTAALHAQDCTRTVQDRAAAALALQARLHVAQSPQMDTDIPASLRPLLHAFKQALIATVDTGLLCNRPAPDRVEADLARLLHAISQRPQPPRTTPRRRREGETPRRQGPMATN